MPNVPDAVLSRIPALRQLRADYLASHFDSFCQQAWSVVFPGHRLHWSPALDLLCSTLTAVRDRQPGYTRVLWNMPVRCGKSFIASISFPVWTWLTEPTSAQFICASYSQDLGSTHHLARRNLIGSRWFQQLFGDRFELSPDRNTTTHCQLVQGAACLVASPTSRLLGFGYTVAILDDVLDAEGALSDATRDSAHQWLQQTLLTRANDPATSSVFSISQRLHEDDITGHLLEAEPGVWKHVAIPLIAEEPQQYTFPDGRVWKRPVNDTLMSKRFPPRVLRELRARRLVWASQYQQSPLDLSGNMVRRADIRYHSGIDRHTGEPDEQLPQQFDYKLTGVDCAFKDYSTSDYTAVITVGVKGPKRFILDVINQHLDVNGMEQAIRAQIARWGPVRGIIIEAAASGVAVAQRLRINVGNVIEVQPSGGKIARFAAVSPEFQAGQWLVDRNASWAEPLRLQLLAFPKSKNDDMVDAIAHLGAWIATQPVGCEGGWVVVSVPRMIPGMPQQPQRNITPEIGAKIIAGQPLSDAEEWQLLAGHLLNDQD